MEFLAAFTHNPIINQAMSTRRLDWKFIGTLILAGLVYCPAALSFAIRAASALFATTPDQTSTQLAQTLFYITATLLLILATLFAPVLSIGAIAGERQRQTLPLLLITLLPARRLVLGKLVAALLNMAILIGLVWPLILITAVLGHIPLFQLGVYTILLVTTALAFTTVGLYVSGRSKSLTSATLLTYGLVLPGLLIGPLLMMGLISLAMLSNDSLDEMFIHGWLLATGLNPITTAVTSYIMYEEGMEGIIRTPGGEAYYLVPPWIIYVLFYGFLTWLLFELTVQYLGKVSET